MQPKKQANDDRPEGRKQHRADVVEPRKALQPERGNQVDVHETERCGHLLVDARKADAAIEADVHVDLSESPQRLGARAALAHHLLHPNDVLTNVFTSIFISSGNASHVSCSMKSGFFGSESLGLAADGATATDGATIVEGVMADDEDMRSHFETTAALTQGT